MIDLTMASLLPLLVSCLTATCITYALTGTEAMFSFELTDPFTVGRVPTAILLGVFCGLISLYFTRSMNSFEQVFGRFKSLYSKLLLGGSVLALLIYLFPPLYGEGYTTINTLLSASETQLNDVMNNSFFYGHSEYLLLYLGLIILFKVFATTATNGGGGCGGTFAPSLFLGCIAGFVFSRVWNIYSPFDIYVPETNYALLGMAGLMSGVMHAPLTGIFLIAELTGGYDLFLPLMITSAFSYLTIRVFQTHSIYSMRLAKKGELLTHHKDQSILTLMRTENVVENDFKATTTDTELGRFTTVISDSHRNLFPVLNKDNRLVGIVQLDDVRHYMFRSELYHRYTMDKFMREPVARISVTDAMDVVMRKFDETRAWNLPVEDEDGRYLGFVFCSNIFYEYRKIMLDYSDE
jgi:CIC family chloride channel protein